MERTTVSPGTDTPRPCDVHSRRCVPGATASFDGRLTGEVLDHAFDSHKPARNWRRPSGHRTGRPGRRTTHRCPRRSQPASWRRSLGRSARDLPSRADEVPGFEHDAVTWNGLAGRHCCRQFVIFCEEDNAGRAACSRLFGFRKNGPAGLKVSTPIENRDREVSLQKVAEPVRGRRGLARIAQEHITTSVESRLPVSERDRGLVTAQPASVGIREKSPDIAADDKELRVIRIDPPLRARPLIPWVSYWNTARGLKE